MPVARRYVRPARLDFPVIRYPHFLARQHLAERIQLLVAEAVARHDRRRFRRAVALQHDDAQRLPLLRQWRVQAGAAAHDEQQLAAKALMHLAEQLPAQPHRQPRRNAEDFFEFFLPPGEFRLPLDGVHEEFQRLRHEHDAGDAVLLHRPHQYARLAAGGIHHAAPAKHDGEKPHRLFQHVAQRQEREQTPVGLRGYFPATGNHVGNDVPVGENHAFWRAGGP